MTTPDPITHSDHSMHPTDTLGSAQPRTSADVHVQTRPDTHGHGTQQPVSIETPAPVTTPDQLPTDVEVGSQSMHDRTRTDASGDAHPRTDVNGHDQARPGTTMRPDHTPPPANWLTIDQVIQKLADAGVPRKLRTIQKYCTNGRLSSHLALTDVGFKYFIDPASIDAFIARAAQMAPLASEDD